MLLLCFEDGILFGAHKRTGYLVGNHPLPFSNSSSAHMIKETTTNDSSDNQIARAHTSRADLGALNEQKDLSRIGDIGGIHAIP